MICRTRMPTSTSYQPLRVLRETVPIVRRLLASWRIWQLPGSVFLPRLLQRRLETLPMLLKTEIPVGEAVLVSILPSILSSELRRFISACAFTRSSLAFWRDPKSTSVLLLALLLVSRLWRPTRRSRPQQVQLQRMALRLLLLIRHHQMLRRAPMVLLRRPLSLPPKPMWGEQALTRRRRRKSKMRKMLSKNRRTKHMVAFWTF
mmetsp:Transcript_29822/g.87003  ORF Transcript_29822/g.87003 Transcript_29822/m.87003 type:complete len:204 (+) Transcript_29822:929-1540(+)